MSRSKDRERIADILYSLKRILDTVDSVSNWESIKDRLNPGELAEGRFSIVSIAPLDVSPVVLRGSVVWLVSCEGYLDCYSESYRILWDVMDSLGDWSCGATFRAIGETIPVVSNYQSEADENQIDYFVATTELELELVLEIRIDPDSKRHLSRYAKPL